MLSVRWRCASVERKLVVCATVQEAAGETFPHAAPLLEEEWHVLGSALALDLYDPLFAHGPRMRAALAPDDDPSNPREVQVTEIFKQRLN